MQTLSNTQVGEAALREIGAYSVNDSASDPAELDVALFWLDQIVGFYTAVNDAYWLVTNTFTITLVADQVSYDLENALGSNATTEGVLFVESVYVTDGSGNDTPIDKIRRDQYEAIENKTTSGTPDRVYIDRKTPTETLYVYPVMGSGGTNTLKVVLRNYSEDLTKERVAATHGLPPEWQMWMIIALAARIGSGPVRRLPVNEIKEMERKAKVLYDDLQSYANREHDSGYRTARWDA